MIEKLYIPLVFSILEAIKLLISNHRMHNLYAIFIKFHGICKQFTGNLVNESGNVPRCGVVPKFLDLEVVALSLTAETESIDSENLLFSKLSEYTEQLPNLISRRQFNDRRKFTITLCEEIRKRIADSVDDGENCASQGTYYYGYKLHALCGLSGVTHYYDLTKAGVHDINYLNDIKYLYHDCSIFWDRGYIGKEMQLDLFETANIKIECPYRLNQKYWKPIFIPFAKAHKRIETVFSQLCDQFMLIRNYAKGAKGLFAKVIGKISALTILQYVNKINNKPIGQIKYALI